MSLSRLSGLVLIVNTLLPALLVLGMIGIFYATRGPTVRLFAEADTIASEVKAMGQDAVQPTMAVIASKIDDTKTRLDVANRAYSQFARQVDIGFGRFNDITLPRIPSVPTFWGDIDFPRLPTLHLGLGDALSRPFDGIRGALEYMLVVITNFKDIAAATRTLIESDDLRHLLAHVQEARDAQRVLAQRVGTILDVVAVLLFLVIPWMLLSYGLWSYRRLVRGWALIRGDGSSATLESDRMVRTRSDH